MNTKSHTTLPLAYLGAGHVKIIGRSIARYGKGGRGCSIQLVFLGSVGLPFVAATVTVTKVARARRYFRDIRRYTQVLQPPHSVYLFVYELHGDCVADWRQRPGKGSPTSSSPLDVGCDLWR